MTTAQDQQSRTLPSTQLLQGQKAVNIEHKGMTYELRATRHGKLILTKPEAK